MYLTNEDYTRVDDISQVLTSSDEGESWQSSVSAVPLFFSGSVAIGRQCTFVSTNSSGIYRETGGNWISISGPNSTVDTRSICAINDSLVIALDGLGNIWRTTNSGGFPIPNEFVAPSLSPNSLFSEDTISPCSIGTSSGTSTRSVIIRPYSGDICIAPKIVS